MKLRLYKAEVKECSPQEILQEYVWFEPVQLWKEIRIMIIGTRAP